MVDISAKLDFVEAEIESVNKSLYTEERYLARLRREQQQHQSEAIRFLVFSLISLTIFAFAVIRVVTTKQPESETGKVDFEASANSVLYLFALLFLIVGGVASFFSLKGFFHHMRRRFSDQDHRDNVWKTYTEMELISAQRTRDMKATLVSLDKEHDRLEAIVNKEGQAFDNAAPEEQETVISEDELLKVSQEDRKGLQEMIALEKSQQVAAWASTSIDIEELYEAKNVPIERKVQKEEYYPIPENELIHMEDFLGMKEELHRECDKAQQMWEKQRRQRNQVMAESESVVINIDELLKIKKSV